MYRGCAELPDLCRKRGSKGMIGREEKKSNDLFYTCSLIDYIARKTKNRRKDIVDALGEERITKIPNGTFDSVARTKYALPSHWDIGKVFKRLILGISKEKEEEVIPALFEAYHSFVSEKIEDFNSSFYYDAPQNILNAYLTGTIE